MSEEFANDHLSSEEIAAYWDGAVGAEEKERIQSHMADCSICRAEMTELSDLLHAHGRRRRWTLAASGVAAAAAVAVLLIGAPLSREGTQESSRMRSPETATQREAVPTIPAIAPPGDATLEQTELVFVWHSIGEGTVYRLSVTDEGGDPLWRTQTHDTATRLPSDVVLERGAVYLWYADALLADGQTATTGVQRFRTAQ